MWGIPPAQVNAFYNPNKNDIGKTLQNNFVNLMNIILYQ